MFCSVGVNYIFNYIIVYVVVTMVALESTKTILVSVSTTTLVYLTRLVYIDLVYVAIITYFTSAITTPIITVFLTLFLTSIFLVPFVFANRYCWCTSHVLLNIGQGAGIKMAGSII